MLLRPQSQPSPHATSSRLPPRPFSTTFQRLVSLLKTCRESIRGCVEACVRPFGEAGTVTEWFRTVWEGEEGPEGRSHSGKQDL